MQFKIFSAPGDHRDDFKNITSQMNEWIKAERPKILDIKMDVTAMTDDRNIGRYLMSVLVGFRPAGQ